MQKKIIIWDKPQKRTILAQEAILEDNNKKNPMPAKMDQQLTVSSKIKPPCFWEGKIVPILRGFANLRNDYFGDSGTAGV